LKVKTKDFQKNSTNALADNQLQIALERVVGHFDVARKDAIEEMTTEVWDRYRDRGREMKRHTIENLDHYLNLLSHRVERNGGVVHFAKDDQQATDIVVEIARARGVRSVVKSKSMLSEEMDLNHVLEKNGIEPIETDLGEYIIQLADETPFHIIAPAMHKSKEQVSELFFDKLKTKRLTKIEDMAEAARVTLREKFLKADMGISGVNFAVAETGTVVIVTNEGNGRLSTSLPKIHVALMGMEKVIPALEDMAIMLRLLTRAATGQRITSYVNFVSGPRRRDDEDGPEEFHLVIMDNGRSKLLADPDLRESLYCIRCGACLNICPVYRKVGGHAYGWVYPGPIGAVITPVMTGLSEAKDLPFASTLCGACKEVCPVKINIPHMLLKLRTQLTEGDRGQRNVSRLARLGIWIWSRVVGSQLALSFIRGIAVQLQRPFVTQGRLRRLPFPPFSQWTKRRDFPALAQRSFHKLWSDELKHSGKPSRGRSKR
jgi:L-lactate dehydrogenase complex protein LldF